MAGTLHLLGNVHVEYVDLGTGERREWTSHNTVTSGALSLLTQYLATADPTAAPLGPMFLALGISDTVPFAPTFFTQTVPGEYCRTPVCQRDTNGLSAVFHAYVSSINGNSASTAVLLQADFDNAIGIAELTRLTLSGSAGIPVGYFGLYGGLATDVLRTGTLIACASGIPFIKDVTKTFNVDWTLTISGQL